MFLQAVLAAALTAQAPEPQVAVAVIASLSGKAMITPLRGESQTARVFDWLSAGTSIQASQGSRLVLAFVDGRRFEISGSAKATVGTNSLTELSGAVRALDPAPPLPKLAAIAPAAHASTKSAAIRIRGASARMYPRDGYVALASRPVFFFERVPDATSYEIEIEDEDGNKVFEKTTSCCELVLAPQQLKPGTRYYWYVRAAGNTGVREIGPIAFSTLNADAESSRLEFKSALSESNTQGLLLLAAVDRRLGLIAEARDELQAVIDAAEETDGLRQRLVEMQEIVQPGRKQW